MQKFADQQANCAN